MCGVATPLKYADMNELKWAISERKQVRFICAGVAYQAEAHGIFNDARSRAFTVSLYILQGPGEGSWRDIRYANLRELEVMRDGFAARHRYPALGC